MTPARFIVSCLASGLLLGGIETPDLHAQSLPYKTVPPGMNRFALTRTQGTVAPGQKVEVDIELQSPSGTKIAAPSDLATTITVTTLSTLALAKARTYGKSETGGPPGPHSSRSLDRSRLVLPAQLDSIHIRGVFPRGERDIEIRLTSHRTGLIRVFVEADGVVSGSTIVAVGSPTAEVIPDEYAGPRLIWASFQPLPPRPRVRLSITDSGEDVLRQRGEFVQHFWVTLESMTGSLGKLPVDLDVQFDLKKGRGRFVQRSVRIPAGQSLAETAAELRSRQGGEVVVLARTSSESVEPREHPYTFAVAPHATRLEVSPSSPSALANGLDSIKLTIRAMEDRPDSSRHVMTAAQEGMNGRRVTFKFRNGACWFAQKATHVVMEPDQTSADITLFCSRPFGALGVVAHAENGLEEPIQGETIVAFHLPFMQLGLAALGAITFPMIWRRGTRRLLVALVVGIVVYSVFFFGAVATGEFGLGPFLVTVTKLPTENVLAAFALGVLAYLAVAQVVPDKTGP